MRRIISLIKLHCFTEGFSASWRNLLLFSPFPPPPLRFQENKREVFRRRTYKVSPVSYDVKKIVKNCVLVPKQSPPAVLRQVGTNTGKGGTVHICEHRTLQVPPTLFFFVFPTSSDSLVCKRSGVGAEQPPPLTDDKRLGGTQFSKKFGLYRLNV